MRAVLMPRILTALVTVLCLLPSVPAQAQLETFAAAVRDLAATAHDDTPGRNERLAAVAARLQAALAEWDRRLASLEADVAGAVAGADGDRAYALQVQLGVAYRARGRNADAVRAFDAALARRPSGEVQLLRALTLDATGRRDEAAGAYTAAWRLDPTSAVKAYYAVQRSDALEPAERARIRTVLGGAYQRLGPDTPRPSAPPFPVLDAVPDRLGASPIVGDRITAAAFGLLAAGRYADAVEALKAALKHPLRGDSPLDAFARAQRAEAENRVPDARRDYEASLAGTLAGRRLIHVGLARLAQVDGDPAAAIAAFVRAAECDPNDVNVHKELAAAYAADGRVDEAYAELVAALLIDPRDAQAHGDLGQLLLDRGRHAEAVTAFTRALALNAGAYEIHYALATALTRLGRTDDATRELDIYDRLRRQHLEERRRGIATDVERAEAIRRTRPPQSAAP
jgi:tetratricopeptide (TPR) repeat protein